MTSLSGSKSVGKLFNRLLIFPLLYVFILECVSGQNGNKSPSFLTGGDLYKFSIYEDTPVGSVIYRLKGLDPEGGVLTYSISGEYFRVNKKTGDLTLIKELDRETESSIDVIISLTDDGGGSEPLTFSLRRELTILDRNDNPPVFHRRPYSIKISERTAVGSTVFSDLTITDADESSNSEVTLTCAEDETPLGCSTFSISVEKVGDGKYIGIITLASPLDFEQHSSFSLTLRATDGKNEAKALVAITILDVQDQAPKFLGGEYVFKVKENSPPGTRVGEISVQDGDTGNPRDLQIRLIDDSGANCFRLTAVRRDPFNGAFSAVVETTENILDAEDELIRENLGVYELTLEAREFPLGPEDGEPTLVTRTSLAIVVEDLDDHIPMFSPSSFSRVFSVPFTPNESYTFPDFAVSVEDGDVERIHSKFSLQFEWSLVDSPIDPNDIFSFVTPQNDVPTIQSKGMITMEIGNVSMLQPGLTFDLYIVAIQNDHHIVNKLNVPIEVARGPKILPTFNSTVMRVTVSESLKEGDVIAKIAAKNHDQIPSVKYSLIGVGAEKFNVEEKTGNILCARKNCLDFEEEKSHFFLVRAKAGSGVEDEAFALFYLDVEEANDNTPEFVPWPGTGKKNSELRRSVQDGTLVFDPPFIVKAKDSDLNDRITYTVVDNTANNSGITIDSETGELLLQRPLRWAESGEHKLVVTATDKTGKASIQQVHLVVQAVSNLPPKFSFKTHRIEVPETKPLGSVIFKAAAHDPDGQDSEMRYEIQWQPEPDLFIVEEKSGIVRINGKLDYEDKLSQYELKLRVTDVGKPPESAVASLIVAIVDENDELPEFSKKNYLAEMSESSMPEKSVLKVEARDKDEGAELEFSLSCPCQVWDASGSMGSYEDANTAFNNFRIDKDSGQVILLNSMEHKKTSVVEFNAIVKDNNGISPQNDTAIISIYILAAEKNKPIFGHPWTTGNPWINLTIPENIEPGSTVVTLNAWDYIADIPISTFLLEKGDDIKQFTLENNELKVSTPLDFEAQKIFILAVNAEDSRGGESTANLAITVSDHNDNSPVFSKREYKGKIVENSEYPTPILTVEASDRDDPENYGAVRYRLTGPNSHLFTIDELAGVVQVAPGALIDREKDTQHLLTVIASDTPQGGPFQLQSTATINITVTDVNDNEPSCTIGEELLVGESEVVGKQFGNISCIDLDENPKLTFTIKDSNGLFGIESTTGKLFVAKSLRGRGRSTPYTLDILIEDGKERTSLLSIPVKVTNLIPNDGRPYFKNDNLTAFISESAPRGSPVLLLKAEDSDSYDNGEGRLIFKMLKQIYPCQSKVGSRADMRDVDIFRLDEQTGLLSTRESIDREKMDCFSLLVSVEDFGTPPQSQSQWFEIIVSDIDDQLPKTPKILRTTQVAINESSPIGTPILNITSEDEDIYPNNQVTFEISGGGSDFVKIVQDNYQNATLILDGDLRKLSHDSLTVVIKCYPKDKKISLPECVSKVTIRVVRTEENIGKMEELVLGVASGSGVGSLIGNAGMPKVFSSSAQMFHPNSVNQSPRNVTEIFKIDPITGDIFVWDNLDFYKDGHVRVEMADTDGGSMKKQLKVFVVPNEQLLSADTAEYSKLQKWVAETGDMLNAPTTKINRGWFRLLTFDHTNAADGKTKICFQLLENENMMNQEKALQLLENDDIQDVFLKYSFDQTYKGCPQKARTAARLTFGGTGGRFWVERSLVGIASVVAIATISAILILCLVNRSRRD